MYIKGKACWLNHLDAALEKYIIRAHHAIRMTPFEANNKLIPNVIPNLMPSKKKQISSGRLCKSS